VFVCPDCAAPLDYPPAAACPSCGWAIAERDGIPEAFSSAGRDSAIVRHYLDNYEAVAGDDLAESIQDEGYLQIQTERLFSYLGDVSGLDVCDLGVGQGRLLELIAAQGPASLTGVDIASPYLKRLSTDGVRIVIANAENLPFAEEFDLLVASDILEHVLNIGDALLSIHRALRPGGRFVVRVPYKENLTMYAQASGLTKYELVHLRNFNRAGLRQLLEDAGFAVGGFRYDGYYAYRKRAPLQRSALIGRALDRALVRRYGSIEAVAGVDRRLGRLLMRPVEITALATKPTG
jgi:SAM-dependent methyltransferase